MHRFECNLSTSQSYRVKQLPLAMEMPKPTTPSSRYDIWFFPPIMFLHLFCLVAVCGHNCLGL